MTQHCTIVLDLDDLGIRARVRDTKLIIDVPDDKLDRLRAALAMEVTDLKAALKIANGDRRG